MVHPFHTFFVGSQSHGHKPSASLSSVIISLVSSPRLEFHRRNKTRNPWLPLVVSVDFQCQDLPLSFWIYPSSCFSLSLRKRHDMTRPRSSYSWWHVSQVNAHRVFFPWRVILFEVLLTLFPMSIFSFLFLHFYCPAGYFLRLYFCFFPSLQGNSWSESSVLCSWSDAYEEEEDRKKRSLTEQENKRQTGDEESMTWHEFFVSFCRCSCLSLSLSF